jgi:uncharacterized protein YoxC
MAGDVTRDEFNRLESRVDVLDREVEGEKLVTRHVLEQTRRNGDDLAAIKTRLDRVEGKVDDVSQEVRGLKTTIDGLVRNLPNIVSEAVRKTLPTRRGKQ